MLEYFRSTSSYTGEVAGGELAKMSDPESSSGEQEGPGELRGICPVCVEDVTTTQDRSEVDGEYYHEECLEAYGAKRGDCPECHKGVFATQDRSKHNGQYYHDECLEWKDKKSFLSFTCTECGAQITAPEGEEEYECPNCNQVYEF